MDRTRLCCNYGQLYINTSRFDAYSLRDNIIAAYSEASLTYGKDELIALSGMAKYMRAILQDTYLAGHWQRYLFSQLLWTYEAPGRRPNEYRAPSWSWASIDAPPSRALSPGRTHDQDIVAVIIDMNIETPTQDTTGQVTGGYIRGRGSLCTAHFHRSKDKDKRLLPRMDVTNAGSVQDGAVYEDAVDELCESDESTDGHEYHLSMIQQRNDALRGLDGLVLQPTGLQRGQFRRCSLLQLNYDDSETTIRGAEQESWLQYEKNHG